MEPRDIGAGVDPARLIQAPNATQGHAKPVDATGKSDAPAFHVLLERLQAQASELEAKTPTVGDAEQLAGAVGIARASLDEAATLTDRLLEAFREAEQQSDDAFPGSDKPQGKQ